MTNIIGSSVIKRFISASLVITVILMLLTGCSATENTSLPVADNSLTQAADEEDGKQPGKKVVLPIDLLSDEFNVFSHVSFPENFSVYAAGFENNVDFYFYELYLTAQGKPEDIITYVSNLVGDSAEESIRQNIDYFNRDGFVGIDGTQIEGGLNADCLIEATKEDDYDYEYVEGCTLRLRARVKDPSSYQKIIKDNYNLNSLSEMAGFIDLTSITGRSEVYVRKARNNAQIDAVYSNIEDVGEILENIKAAMAYQNFNENINVMNLYSYGDVSNNVLFDIKNNSISIFQNLNDAGKSYKDYKTATTGLTDLGFQNYIEQDALCEYKDEVNNLSLAINIPQWGSRPDEWENSCVLFLKDINGYLLAIWYYPDEQRYTIQADKEDTSAKYEYFQETGEFDGEYPDPETVKSCFEDVYRGHAADDVYMESIRLLNGYVNDTFGMSIDELYALAAGV